jgi:hypothetical protein
MGKETLMRLAGRLARLDANDPLPHADVAALTRLGEGLRLSPAHLRGLLAEIREPATVGGE